MRGRRVAGASALGIVVLGSAFMITSALSGAREVRWLISHEPVDAFTRAADVFADVLEEESGGALKLVVLTPEDVGLTTKGDVPSAEVKRLLDTGRIELASDYTVALGKEAPQFWGLTMPFLFDSYDKAISYLESANGDAVLESLESAHALAFTMSGGFRIVASDETAINDASDFAGLRIGTSGGPVAEATLRALGAEPIALDLESGSVDLTSLDGVETTYARLSAIAGSNSPYVRHISETNHNLFLTAILAGNAFYTSLSSEEQRALRVAARAAARVEREDSIALNAETKEKLQENGSSVYVPTTAARNDMKQKVKGVYGAFTF